MPRCMVSMPQRVESRVDFERTVESLDVFAGDAGQFVAHHLPLQFVAVCTCNDTETQSASPAMLNDILADAELLVDGKFCRNYGLNHISCNVT